MGLGALAAVALLVATTQVAAAEQPNIVFILTDDQDSLLGGDWHMPLLAKHLSQEGINFTHFVTPFPLCCPARASILTGLCPHNHGVPGNFPPLGGIKRFNEAGMARKTAPYILQQAGYRTGFIGKYIHEMNKLSPRYIPPGFDRFFVIRKYGYFDWVAADQGIAKKYGRNESDYQTDVLTEKAVEFIAEHASDPRPFFLMVSPFAPHDPVVPAPRHQGKLKGLTVPRVPNYNESRAAINTKVNPILRRSKPLSSITAKTYDVRYQLRAESLLAVDEQVAAVVQALEEIGQLNNTFFFYTSDNGFKLGHHRRTAKYTAYEEDIRVPFFVRGAGVAQGIKLPHLVSQIDLLPTWLDLAGVEDPYATERNGKSFVELLLDDSAQTAPDAWRIGLSVEKLLTLNGDKFVSPLVPPADPAYDIFRSYRAIKASNRSRAQVKKSVSKAKGELPDDDWIERHEEAVTSWRMYKKELAVQGVHEERNDRRGTFPTAYYALRIQSTLGSYKLIQYPEGYELYDLKWDPYELKNIFKFARKTLRDYLVATLDSLKVCRGAACSVENVTELALALK